MHSNIAGFVSLFEECKVSCAVVPAKKYLDRLDMRARDHSVFSFCCTSMIEIIIRDLPVKLSKVSNLLSDSSPSQLGESRILM